MTGDKDWSLNLEDLYYAEHRDEAVEEAIQAIRSTKAGYYVNIVTPNEADDPHEWLIPSIEKRLETKQIKIRDIRYIDQCGCGGYVTRIFR